MAHHRTVGRQTCQQSVRRPGIRFSIAFYCILLRSVAFSCILLHSIPVHTILSDSMLFYCTRSHSIAGASSAGSGSSGPGAWLCVSIQVAFRTSFVLFCVLFELCSLLFIPLCLHSEPLFPPSSSPESQSWTQSCNLQIQPSHCLVSNRLRPRPSTSRVCSPSSSSDILKG